MNKKQTQKIEGTHKIDLSLDRAILDQFTT